jgi:hypothetical protein
MELMFNEFQWFQPVHYGRARMYGRLGMGGLHFDALLTHYDQFQNITITGRTERDSVMLFPAKGEDPPHAGTLIWVTAITEARKEEWRNAHQHQVAEVMRLLGSPLSQCGTAEDLDRKTLRLVPAPDGFGSVETFTVRDSSEGLAGLYWRNFFGPPFIRMFGERLLSLPADTRQELGGGLVLVQPYALPTQAMTPDGDASEQRLITLLGRECFYDHAQHRKPTRVPEFTRPST